MKEDPAIDLRIGSSIRTERERRGISLRQLAARAGLTPSGLSQIERGVMHPSLLSLRRVADSLDMPMFWFVLDHQTTDPDIVVRKADRVAYQVAHMPATIETLTRGLNRALEGMTCTIAPGKHSVAKPVVHQGDEITLLLSGELQVEVAGSKYSLGPGDSIYISNGLAHRYVNTGTTDAEAVMVVSAAVTHALATASGREVPDGAI
jgi:transcriptional regulator with XRE-family HTH domain